MFEIRIFTLGNIQPGESLTHTIKRSEITSRELEAGLKWCWAWNGMVEGADGPAVAVEFPTEF
jgi:hypothetical protein